MRKTAALFLAIVLILTAAMPVSVLGEEASESKFTLTEESTFDLVNGRTYLYEHVKTGAQVMFIINDDLNRVFQMAFRTPAETDMGVSHVFEHATLGGSEKYPSKDLFFNLSYQTYNTYMNASTANYMTFYPVASLSEEQLLRYADFYTDSCFNPLVLKDESLFRQEAWRYRMDTEDAPLTIEGTVYSEMKGAYDLDRAAMFNALKTIYPGSTCGNVHGGIPEEIIHMTWDDLKNYHEKYYHPSNSLTLIYGDIADKDAFLDLLDGYFSAYERREIVIDDGAFTPLTESVTAEFPFPGDAGADPSKQAQTYYAIYCDGATEEDLVTLDLLTTLMSVDSSAVMNKIREKLPAAKAGCYVDDTTSDITVIFYASNLDREEAETFRAAVDEGLAVVKEEGFDSASVDALMANTLISQSMVTESSSVGVDMLSSVASYWALDGDVHGYEKMLANQYLFESFNEQGRYTEAVERLLISPKRTALATTYMVPGLAEEKAAAEAERLAAVKASLTEEETAALIAQALPGDDGEKDEADETTLALVSQLQAVTLASLPEEARIYTVTDEVKDGLRTMWAQANVDGVGTAMGLLDAQGFTAEELLWVKLYTDLIGSLNTSAHTRAQLKDLEIRYLYNGVIRPSLLTAEDGLHPYVRFAFTALDDDLAAGYDLMYEILFDTDFNDLENLNAEVSGQKAALRSSITGSAMNILVYRGMGRDDDTYAAYSYMNYLEYYDFLAAVEAQLQADPAPVAEKLREIQARFLNRSGAVSAFAGGESSLPAFEKAAAAFFGRLEEKPMEKQALEFPRAEGSEGLIVGGNVQYNVVFAPWEKLGADGYIGAMDAVTNLLTDMYLMPVLRDEYGAYGAYTQAMDKGLLLYTYRDPNVANTFEVYKGLPAVIAALDVDQETLNGYILSAYSYYAQSSGELTGAASAILTELDYDESQESKIEYMRSLKGLTVESLHGYADLYQKLMEEGYIATAGGAAAISENADLYAAVIDPFAAAAGAGFEDLPEDHPFKEEVDTVVAAGLMAPLTDTAFGVDESATWGDYAAGLAALMGAAGVSGADAVPLLQQYGYLDPAAVAEESMTRAQACDSIALVLTFEDEDYAAAKAAEYPDKEGAPEMTVLLAACELLPTRDGALAAEEPITRGELAYMLAFLAQ